VNWIKDRGKWLIGLVKGAWFLLFPTHMTSNDQTPQLLEARRIFFCVQPILLVGFVLVSILCKEAIPTAILWALACFVIGVFAGFLFGIPKVIQAATRKREEVEPRYRQRVNTNLEEISDWLTKTIVGLGLIELYKMPAFFRGLGEIFAANVGKPETGYGVFVAAILFFLIGGFLLSYLITRLYLQGAIGRADLAVPDESAEPKTRTEQSPTDVVPAVPQTTELTTGNASVPDEANRPEEVD